MNVEIIAVGTEILLGDIVNTNAQYISRRLADMGIAVYHHTAVGDNPKRIQDAFALAYSRADIVITTGGLGPTNDDLTREMCAEFFGRSLVLNAESLDRIKQFFVRIGRTMTDNNIKQAMMPEQAIAFQNNAGTAPGCAVEDNGRVMIILPGPPREMQHMFEDSVVPYLSRFSTGVLVSRVLHVVGVGESAMAQKVIDLLTEGSNPTVAPYAKEGEALLRITAHAATHEAAQRLIEPVEREIYLRLGDSIYGTDDTTLEAETAKLLISKNLSIALAESCTGGMICARLVNYPGISAVLKEAVVTYSNESKQSRVNVLPETLSVYGAVSAETAAEMAQGAARTSGADIGVSVTGIAGPDGGSDDKPVGLVYAALSIGKNVQTRKFTFTGERSRIRLNATVSVIDWLRRELIALS